MNNTKQPPSRIKIAELDYQIYNETYHCDVMLSEYIYNSQPALFLIDSSFGEAIANCSLCIENINLREGQIIIKDHAENQGMLSLLIANNIISEPIEWKPAGYRLAPICNLLKTTEYKAEEES